MKQFSFYNPTRIVFGKDTEQKTGELIRQAGGKKVLVLYGGGSVVKNGLLAKVEDVLKKSEIPYLAVGGVQPNPLLSFSKKVAEQAQAEQVDFILAVGGGSVIDSAKAIALILANPGVDPWAFFTKEIDPKCALPVGVVLSISAAGSEMSNSCVQTNDALNNTKYGLGHDLNRPRFAIMNPENTYSLPADQISCGITDIMMHTLDRYFVRQEEQGNELTDQIAEGLLRTVIRFGPILLKNPSDYDAASEMMWCSSVSHNGLTGLGSSSDFAPHQLAHELSGIYNATHGAALSGVWGTWAKDVVACDPARFARYARAVWGVSEADEQKAAQEGIRLTVEFFRSIDMPTTLTELLGFTLNEEQVKEMAERCTYFGKRTIGNIRVMGYDDIYRVYWTARA